MARLPDERVASRVVPRRTDEGGSHRTPAPGWPLTGRQDLALAGAGSLGRGALRVLGKTLRLTEVNAGAVERLWATGGPVIYAVWHGRMLMFPHLYGRRRSVHVLISWSRDGEILSRLMRGFGLRVVRGSSSRGGAAAIRQLARLLRDDRAEVGLAPDGPRGPRYVAQPGAVLLAKLGRAPIVPVGFGASRCTRLSSWDEFIVPHPFARVAVVFGEPIRVEASVSRGELEGYRRELETSLQRVTREAERRAGARRVSAV